MAVPRNRTSNSRKNMRRSHHAKTPVNLSSCSNCGKMRLSHKVCPGCGHYKNKAVITSEKE